MQNLVGITQGSARQLSSGVPMQEQLGTRGIDHDDLITVPAVMVVVMKQGVDQQPIGEAVVGVVIVVGGFHHADGSVLGRHGLPACLA